MQPSSNFCRAQEARQHDLAAGATLINVRDVATLAAAAWAKEAAAAEKREERKARVAAQAEAGISLALPLPDDRRFSENPDRGFADGGAVRS
jgi:hypothetical protein